MNELGVKWWHDDVTTHYAQRADAHGTTIDVVCFYLEEPNGRRTRVLISKDGKVIEEDQNIEALAVKIDVRKFLKRYREKTTNVPHEGDPACGRSRLSAGLGAKEEE